MDVLLVITLVCFFALFVTALATARHIRIVGPQNNRVHHDQTWLGSAPPPRAANSRQMSDQSVHQLVEHKQPDWRYLISGERRTVFSNKIVSPAMRRPPESARLDLSGRSDWTYFNQDRAYLSDPYTHPAAKAASTGGSRSR